MNFDSLLSKIEDALVNATDAGVHEELTRLHQSLVYADRDSFTEERIKGIILGTPALRGQTTPSSKMKARDATCASCGSPIEGDTCTNCRSTIRRIGTGESRSKTKDTLAGKISDFNREFEIRMGISGPLIEWTTPRAKDGKIPLDIIRTHLLSLGYTLPTGAKPTPMDVANGKKITIADMRLAFRAADLQTQYKYCNAVRYYLTHYRPKQYTVEERALWAEYYSRAVEAYHRAANSKSITKKNLWGFEAFMKSIFFSSPRLKKDHEDLLDVLHNQNSNTELEHSKIWTELMYTNHWTFE